MIGKKITIKEFKNHQNGRYETNPHFERWGKGRPSKEKLLKRKLSDEWEYEYRKKYSNCGFIEAVKDDTGENDIFIVKSNKLKINWGKRTFDN